MTTGGANISGVITVRYEWHPTGNYSSPQYHDQYGLHTSEGATTRGSLRNWICNPDSQVSYHFAVDNESSGVCDQYVSTDYKSWAQANYNPYALTGCFCTPSGASSGWSRDYWLKNEMVAIENMAAIVGDQCRKYGIPFVALNSSQAQAGQPGIAQHMNYGAGGSNHHDCGQGFPIDVLIDLAKGAGAVTPPKPKPVYPYGEDIEMQLVLGDDGKAALGIPKYAGHLRLVCAQGGTVRVEWVNSSVATREYDLNDKARVDVPCGIGSNGSCIIYAGDARGPVSATWIQTN